MKTGGRVVILISLLGSLAVFYNNCGKNSFNDLNSSSSATDCVQVSDPALQDPKKIDDIVTLINALPKPLTLDCFIANLKKPFKVYAVNNSFSAQPAVDKDSPRIFILNNNLTLGFVPSGNSRDFVELSEIIAYKKSIKGELLFPINENIPLDTPYTRILKKTGTACQTCHQDEARAFSVTTGKAFYSNLLMPLSTDRVDQGYLKDQALNCDYQKDEYRCKILRSIFIDGAGSDVAFPLEPK